MNIDRNTLVPIGGVVAALVLLGGVYGWAEGKHESNEELTRAVERKTDELERQTALLIKLQEQQAELIKAKEAEIDATRELVRDTREAVARIEAKIE